MNEDNQPPQETPTEQPIEQKMQELEEQLSEYKDKYLRLLAETENTRKRMQKEKQEMTRFAIENVIDEILRTDRQYRKCSSVHKPTVRRNAQLGLKAFK